MSSGLINFGHVSHKSCTNIPSVLSRSPRHPRVCNGPLFFIHQAAISLVIPNGRPWLHPCLWVGKVKLGSASPLPLKQPGHDPTNTATKPLVASPRALPSRPERLIVWVKLLEGSTSLMSCPSLRENHNRFSTSPSLIESVCG